MVYRKQMMEILVFSVVFVLSYMGVEKFRQWSLRKQIVDVPNERSSHAAPTPRGGGLIFGFTALTFYAATALLEKNNFRWSYLLGAGLIALISWLDDLFSIGTLVRFVVHAAAAVLIIFFEGYWREIYLPYFGTVDFGAAGAILTFCWVVGLTNAYNFMDGIDGIAGTQAVTAGIGWLTVGHLLGFDATAFYGGVIAFACLGFLLHNLQQPAKIFMGDVGSAFLGYTFAVLPVLATKENVSGEVNELVLPALGVFLVWFFVFDAFYTFVRRLLKKDKVWRAHREHLYQKMVLKGYSHSAVTAVYGGFSLTLLCFLAFGAATASVFGDFLFYALAAAIFLSGALIVLARPRRANRTVNAE
jgi:UDP-N-acetylmuramyl pentapeptide phosphotransferase/UDP-N-acetylglucosamine-1-phosphate transferase